MRELVEKLQDLNRRTPRVVCRLFISSRFFDDVLDFVKMFLREISLTRRQGANLRGKRAKFALETRRLYGKITGGVQTVASRTKTTPGARIGTFNNTVA